MMRADPESDKNPATRTGFAGLGGAYEKEGLRRSRLRIRNSDTSASAAGYRNAAPLRWDLTLAIR